MDRDQIRQVLTTILEEETGRTVPALPDETSIVEQFDLDSVDVVSLLMQVERRFRIRIAHEELGAVATVGLLLDVVQDRIGRENIAQPVAANG